MREGRETPKNVPNQINQMWGLVWACGMIHESRTKIVLLYNDVRPASEEKVPILKLSAHLRVRMYLVLVKK